MIEYKNVALSYTEKDVLRDVNLQIENGEFMVLVGPSGSGKTTMIKMINRLLEPTDGNIYMDGKRIKDYDERELRLSTGYVLQDGEIRQVANPETILKAPATEFVADLFGGSVHD